MQCATNIFKPKGALQKMVHRIFSKLKLSSFLPTAYKHPVVQAIDFMMSEAMVRALKDGQMPLSSERLPLRQILDGQDLSIKAFTEIDDRIIHQVSEKKTGHFFSNYMLLFF